MSGSDTIAKSEPKARPKNELLIQFVATMSSGKRKLTGKPAIAGDEPKVESRSYDRDISSDMQGFLKVDTSARQDVQDWWADLIGHLSRCEISVKIEAPVKTWKKIDANEIFASKFAEFTNERVQAGLPALAQSLKLILLRADADLPPLTDAPTAKAKSAIDGIWSGAQEACNAKIVEFQRTVAGQVVDEIKKTFKDLKETKEDVQKYRIVAGARVFKGVVLIAGNIAHVVASWGATSPLAIVLIARESIEIAQILGKGLADAEDLGRLVVFDLKTIQFAYSDDKDSKAQNNTMEVISGVVSGVLAIEIPNVKNCGIHIGDFDHKVNLLKLDYVKMGEKLTRLRAKIDALEQRTKAAEAMQDGERIHKKLSNKEAIAKFDTLIEQTGLVWSGLFEEVPKVGKMIEEYQAQSADWQKTLAAFQKETSGWTKHVSTIAGILTETAFGMGHVSGEHVESAVEIAAQHLKEGLEAGTIVMNALSDKFLEAIAD